MSSDPWQWGQSYEDAAIGGSAYGEDGGEAEEKEFVGGKDTVIFLIDCSRSMFEEFEDERTFFHHCIKAAHSTLTNKIITSVKDLVGIVFYASELDMPDAARIKELDTILDDGFNFDDEYGCSDTFSLNNALWTCSNMFASVAQKVARRRILLLTNNDSPHEDAPALQRQAVAKANDLREVGIDLELLHMSRSGQRFDYTLFWNNVLVVPEGEEAPRVSEDFASLLERVRMKAHQKRSLMTIPFKLCDGVELGISVYNLLGTAKQSAYTWLEESTNDEVVTKTRYICKGTTQVLMPTDMKSFVFYGGEKVVFDADEVKSIKNFGEPGLLLMGFKPRDRLKWSYNVKNSSFCFPDESVVKGSNCAFAALLDRCLQMDKVAICRLIARANAEPRFVALLPQMETLGDSGEQVLPPGFHIVHLPYADDMRKLSYQQGMPTADDGATALMKKVVSKLDFAWDPDSIDNPALQQHYRALEALALDKDDLGEAEPDHTEPQLDYMKKRVGKYTDALCTELFPEGYDPETALAPKKAASKRKAADGGPAKAKKAAPNLDDVDVEQVFKNGKLNKLTVATLKAYLSSVKVEPVGKKADLIAQVEAYFSS